MAGLVSPKPVSYLQQQNVHYNPYARGGGGLSNYSVTPPLGTPGLIHSAAHQQPSQFLPGGSVIQSLGAQDDGKIYGLVVDLLDPASREGALLELSKKREQYDDLALVLWHSFGGFSKSL
jgi:CCR4-NOT transcription complex subunit 9